jgi:hypothetical protein
MPENEKENYHTIRYGQADGEIKFGHLTADNEVSGVMIRAGRDVKHYITLENTGGEKNRKFRKHSTTVRCPGTFTVKAGDDIEVDKGIPGVYISAESGDIIIRAPSGKIRFEAVDIEMVTMGENNEKGNISLTANEKFIVRTQTTDIQSKVSGKFFSEKTVELIANEVLNMYGGFIDAADGATTNQGSQTLSDNEDTARSNFGIGGSGS